MSYRFSKISKERLATCHTDLIKIMTKAIELSLVDFGIAEGHRSTKKQQEYFAAGKSKCDGIEVLSKHNYTPSLACDFYVWINGKASWHNESLSYLAGLIQGIAAMLYASGEIEHLVRWGGNWDQDGEIITDQLFDDRPHVELWKP